jgi:hypothetical protein
MFDRDDLHKAFLENRLVITGHVLVRMLEKHVRASEIAELLAKGDIRDFNMASVPLPICRMTYTLLNSKILGAVVAYDKNRGQAHIITVFSRFAHFFRSSQNFNTLNSWGLYDYPILEES